MNVHLKNIGKHFYEILKDDLKKKHIAQTDNKTSSLCLECSHVAVSKKGMWTQCEWCGYVYTKEKVF